MTPGALYLSYTGLLEPLGQSQVLAYQERLASTRPVHIISFERHADLANQAKVDAMRERVDRAGIRWHPRAYHKRPSALATMWDVAVGTCVGLWLVRRHSLRIVHARSYVAAVMGLCIKLLTGAKFVFDMRGFWADERVDGKLWTRGGAMYRTAKWFERQFLLHADHVVSLTHAAVAEMERFDYLQARMPPSTVIPTCADLARFRPAAINKAGPFTLGYVGSAGTWYAFDAAVEVYKILAGFIPDAKFMILNRDNHAYIGERLKEAGVYNANVEIRAAAHAEVPELMSTMDAGVFFYTPSYSRTACAPTKLAEFLGCGVPCLSNTGVGDMAEILTQNRVGVAVGALSSANLQAGVIDLLRLLKEPEIRSRCVAGARAHFSLAEGVTRYQTIYEGLD